MRLLDLSSLRDAVSLAADAVEVVGGLAGAAMLLQRGSKKIPD